MSKRTSKQLFRDYVDVWETGELHNLRVTIHDNYVGHPSWGDRNQEGLRERIVAFRQKYPNVRFRIEDQLAEGDKVASRLIGTAKRATDGQEVVLYGLNISRIADERIIEEWMAWEVQPAEPA
jgi:predicted ester cyclase